MYLINFVGIKDCLTRILLLFFNLLLFHDCCMLFRFVGFLKSEQINHINAFYNRYVRYHITTRLFNFQEMLNPADCSLFQKITCPCNCLLSILSEVVNNIHKTSKHAHSYKLDIGNDLSLQKFILAEIMQTSLCICVTHSCLSSWGFYM